DSRPDHRCGGPGPRRRARTPRPRLRRHRLRRDRSAIAVDRLPRAGHPVAAPARLRDAASATPLLGRSRLEATWANVREHAAGPPDYWGQGVVGSNPAVPTTTKP